MSNDRYLRLRKYITRDIKDLNLIFSATEPEGALRGKKNIDELYNCIDKNLDINISELLKYKIKGR